LWSILPTTATNIDNQEQGIIPGDPTSIERDVRSANPTSMSLLLAYLSPDLGSGDHIGSAFGWSYGAAEIGPVGFTLVVIVDNDAV
jgi:hypothetical protein